MSMPLPPLIEPCFAATDLYLFFSFGLYTIGVILFFIFDIFEVWLIWTRKRLLSRDGGKSAFFSFGPVGIILWLRDSG